MGIYSINTVRYLTIDIACGIYNITSVPIYDTLGEEAIDFAISQTQLKTIFLSANHVEKIIKYKKERNIYDSLKNLIIMDKENC